MSDSVPIETMVVVSCPHCGGSGKTTLPEIPRGEWAPVWWTMWHGERVKAIAGPLSRSGKTIKVRYRTPGPGSQQIERDVSPKSVEPRPR